MSSVKKTALTVLAAALLPALTALPAHAAATDDNPGRKQPNPPSVMSTVGGSQLGRPGTQVKLGQGAPVLPKELSGRSWIVADAESGAVLAAHNAHWRLPPASTMKMLFADTVLPRLPKRQVHKVTPAELANVGEGSSLVGIKEDHTYTVHDMWLGVFLRSGNDAVHVLSAMNGGMSKTVRDMQTHAEELQALDTSVVSPDGYDAKGQVSSAYDLTLIARSGMQKKDFREYCATPSAAFPGEKKKGKKRESFQIQNTNRLLTGDYGISPYKGMAGIKNGNTTHAGATFTGVAQRGDKVLLVTVMNPSANEGHAVYKEAARLLDWGFAAAGKVAPVGELVPPKSAETSKGAPSAKEPGAGKDAKGKGSDTSEKNEAQLASTDHDSSGAGVALAITGGALLLLAGGVYLVNRRWPLPALVRRRPRR
ncbi:D-alanyl-D-alanine carboxypeptidase [Streptomyces sp. ISL-98]|uniref:D-alanyl-D-alanine carboxypeptidase family protein n=1 Tax=Streptomyces sp. ISL-98 TaxID=2819192 RepID=UPI0027E5870A|nr:D-alanyl-D-alanine carboxypeptidase [Streptomyces sp. ISL-98]